jgi:DNA-binding Lrp family transcriptional regulator
MAKLEVGEEEEIFSKIKKTGKIEEALATYGTYDLMVRVNFSETEDLDDFIFNVLRKIPGIKDTLTIIVARKIV